MTSDYLALSWEEPSGLGSGFLVLQLAGAPLFHDRLPESMDLGLPIALIPEAPCQRWTT